MKKITLPILSFLLMVTISQAQKKSDLLLEIENLKDSIAKTNIALTEAKKKEKISLAKAELYETQATELQEANKSLLTNLKSFTQVSSQNSKNMTKTLDALQTKEEQLSIIENTISKNDSTVIVLLTNAKQTLGEDAMIAVSNGEVVITENNQNLLDGTKTKLSANGEIFIEKISKILSLNQDSRLTISGTNIGLTIFASTLKNKYAIIPERISFDIVSSDVAPILFKIHPDYANFYIKVREHMKSIK